MARRGDRRDPVEEYLLLFKSEVAPELKDVDETRKFMLFLSSLNKFLEERGLGRIIIVGGFAAELYTGRGYRTADVDIIIEGEEAEYIVRKVLEALGFTREARTYIQDFGDLVEKAIDIVGGVYDKPMKPLKWNLSVKGYYVYVMPPEEVIVSSLASAKFWGVGVDFERAAMVYYAQRDRLDHDYLVARAERERVKDLLDEILKLAGR